MRIATFALVLCACGKSAPEGLPPATDWKGGSGAPAASPGDRPQPGPAAGELPAGHPPMGGLPTDHPPVQGAGADQPPAAAKTLTKTADGRYSLGPYSVAVPPDWTEVPSSGGMRAAQFKLGADAELVVYYFGPQGAGSLQANLDRWIDQFSQPDGKPSKDVAKVEKLKVTGRDATLVSVTGRFKGMAMQGAADPGEKDDQALLAAVTESPSGPYYWKLVGPRKTVDANAAKFRGMLSSLKTTN